MACHEVGRRGRKDKRHGHSTAMVPKWEQIQLLTAQLHKVPLLDEHPVGTEVVIGPNANKPLVLDRPCSFPVAEAKVALAMGAEMAGTGICSR
ncbi:MAG: hypothetical protein AAES65_19515 [Candidatus Thiodiazotropha sp. (ex. Lucinoma kazani)]